MISCVVIFDGHVITIFMAKHNSRCCDPAWNLVRPQWWCWKIYFKTKK